MLVVNYGPVTYPIVTQEQSDAIAYTREYYGREYYNPRQVPVAHDYWGNPKFEAIGNVMEWACSETDVANVLRYLNKA